MHDIVPQWLSQLADIQLQICYTNDIVACQQKGVKCGTAKGASRCFPTSLEHMNRTASFKN